MTRVSVRPYLAVIAALSLAGCTAVGFGIGAFVDKGKPPKHKPVARGDIDSVTVGEAIEVQLWDGRRLSGKYQGLEWAQPEEYARRYEAARTKLEPELRLPALGPGARLVVTEGGTATGDFRGIGPGFVRFLEAGLPEQSIKTHRIVTLADAQGHRVSGDAIEKLLAERRLPTLAGLRIETAGANQVVDHADVAGVSRLVKVRSGKLTGALVGLAIDVAIVVAAANADYYGGSSDSSCSTCTSCPLIDSFDGREWVLDAEPLGGAFYRAAERTDVARLERIVETDGRYRVRIRNDQQEIDHLDAVALRVVDHPRGTEVVPDALGRLHAVRDTHAPTTGRVAPSPARERRTGSVAALVAAADGEAWVSDWRGREASVASDLRDGIELEYPRPTGASSALLVARVGATSRGSQLLAEVLALQGRELGRFYASLDAEPAARDAFERAREREVLPTVRVFDGTAWRTAGYLRDLPSLVMREQAVPLDLREVAGGTLRLRIDGAPGLFSIDRAVVAYGGGEVEVAQTRVLPAQATEDEGRDVLELLRRADGRRHSLRPGRDAVTLAFDAPPRRSGQTRTVLVEATGYYNVIARPEGEPQPEVFRRLLGEPGGVARFALEKLRDRAGS